MEWTTEPPTVPGFYWAWTDWEDRQVIHVYGRAEWTYWQLAEDVGWMTADGVMRPLAYASHVEYWQGPLPLPIPPTVTP